MRPPLPQRSMPSAPLPEWPRSGQKWRGFFAGDPPPPNCLTVKSFNCLGVGNAVLTSPNHPPRSSTGAAAAGVKQVRPLKRSVIAKNSETLARPRRSALNRAQSARLVIQYLYRVGESAIPSLPTAPPSDSKCPSSRQTRSAPRWYICRRIYMSASVGCSIRL